LLSGAKDVFLVECEAGRRDGYKDRTERSEYELRNLIFENQW
jgi:hypothetical protein